LNQLIVGLAPILTYPTGGESFATGSVVRVQWDRNNAPVHAYAQIEYTAQLSGPPAYFSDQVESGANGWVATKTSSGSSWVITNVNSHSATRCWFANDDEVIASQYLTKSALAVSNNAVLAFWHDYDLESGFDGGVVEISTDGGSTWIDIGTNATQNGYNMAIDTGYGSSLAGRPAFSGSSGGYVETRIPLTAYQGQTVGLRFVEADVGTLAATGWWIDDVRIFVDDLQWTAVATTPTNTTGYAWTLPGTVGTDFGVRVKLAASNMTDSAWSVSQAFALKGLPSVTAWPAASPLVVGQALSESTLSGGSASTSGAFAFATPSWVLEAGMALHSVMFTPDDGVNYVAVSGAVNVVVAPVPVVSGFTVNGGVAGSVFRFEAVGGIQYRVRYSDSLSVPLSSWPWVTPPDDGWNSALTNGPFTISDPDATNSPTRFYRLEERAQ